MKKNKLLALATLSCVACFAVGAYLATETTFAEELIPTIEINGHTLSLENDVHIKYAVSVENLADGDTLTLKINETETLISTETTTKDGETYYVFEYTGLSAKQMTDWIYAQAFVERGETTYTSQIDKYSILEYAYNKLGKTEAEPTEAEELKTLLNQMLSYGAASQNYFGYKTDRLATDEFLYVTLENATFEDGFSYDFLKAGESVKIILKEGKEIDSAFAQYVEKNETGELILTIPAEHVWETEYSYDKSYHWYACATCNDVKDKAEHTENEDGECSGCGVLLEETEGILYDISADGTHADVIGYEGTATKIHIAETYQGLPVTSIYDEAFYENDTIISIIIPDSVTTIGGSAFYNCKSLTSVLIPNSVTSIGSYAFYYCKSLTSVVIPDSVTSIGYRAFKYCDSLTSVVIPDSVTTIGAGAFYSCANLRSTYITDIANWCNIDFETSSDESSSSNPLYYAKNLYLNNELVTELVIPDGVTEVKASAFYNCSSLTSVVIGNSVTTIGRSAFYNCSSLTSVAIPDSINSIVSKAFYNCSNLQFNEYGNCQYLGSKDTPYLALIGVKNQSYSNYTIHETTKVIAGSAFEKCSRMSSITIPDSVTFIGAGAFSDCKSLTSVVIPNSVTTIGGSAFYYCTSLTSVVIPNSVTTIGNWVFYSTPNLTIYCEAESQPIGWAGQWNYSNSPVVWGYNKED